MAVALLFGVVGAYFVSQEQFRTRDKWVRQVAADEAANPESVDDVAVAAVSNDAVLDVQDCNDCETGLNEMEENAINASAPLISDEIAEVLDAEAANAVEEEVKDDLPSNMVGVTTQDSTFGPFVPISSSGIGSDYALLDSAAATKPSTGVKTTSFTTLQAAGNFKTPEYNPRFHNPGRGGGTRAFDDTPELFISKTAFGVIPADPPERQQPWGMTTLVPKMHSRVQDEHAPDSEMRTDEQPVWNDDGEVFNNAEELTRNQEGYHPFDRPKLTDPTSTKGAKQVAASMVGIGDRIYANGRGDIGEITLPSKHELRNRSGRPPLPQMFHTEEKTKRTLDETEYIREKRELPFDYVGSGVAGKTNEADIPPEHFDNYMRLSRTGKEALTYSREGNPSDMDGLPGAYQAQAVTNPGTLRSSVEEIATRGPNGAPKKNEGGFMNQFTDFRQKILMPNRSAVGAINNPYSMQESFRTSSDTRTRVELRQPETGTANAYEVDMLVSNPLALPSFVSYPQPKEQPPQPPVVQHTTTQSVPVTVYG